MCSFRRASLAPSVASVGLHRRFQNHATSETLQVNPIAKRHTRSSLGTNRPDRASLASRPDRSSLASRPDRASLVSRPDRASLVSRPDRASFGSRIDDADPAGVLATPLGRELRLRRAAAAAAEAAAADDGARTLIAEAAGLRRACALADDGRGASLAISAQEG